MTIHLVAMCTWLVLAMGLSLLIVEAICGFGVAYGAPVWPWILSSSAGTLLAATIGYVSGIWLGSRWFVGPVVAITLFILRVAITARGLLPYWVVQAYPTTLNTTNPFVEYVTVTFLSQTLWYLSLAVLLVLLVSFVGERRDWSMIAVLPVAAAMTMGLLGLHATNGQVTRGYNERNYVCQSTPIDVCVHSAFEAGLPELETAFTAFNARIAGTSLVANKLEHNVGGVGDTVSDGARSLYAEDLGPGFELNTLTLYLQSYGGIQLCTEAESASLHAVVDGWILGQPDQIFGITDVAKANPNSFWNLDDSGRHAWLVGHEKPYLACTLTSQDFE
ncbi:hypothetical protein [Luethyella okanaganae]|uniref:Uncharacterized protein n=1 Tax=Luethyella okanaganae TaxID=69372 RepID=A0ABW1VGQ8_9MICO